MQSNKDRGTRTEGLTVGGTLLAFAECAIILAIIGRVIYVLAPSVVLPVLTVGACFLFVLILINVIVLCEQMSGRRKYPWLVGEREKGDWWKKTWSVGFACLLLVLAGLYLWGLLCASGAYVGMDYRDNRLESDVKKNLPKIPPPEREVQVSSRPACLADTGSFRILLTDGIGVSDYHYYLPRHVRARSVKDADVIISLSPDAQQVKGLKRVTTYGERTLEERPVLARGWQVHVVDVKRSVMYSRSFIPERFYAVPGTPLGGSPPTTGSAIKWLGLGLARSNQIDHLAPEHRFLLLLQFQFRAASSGLLGTAAR